MPQVGPKTRDNHIPRFKGFLRAADFLSTAISANLKRIPHAQLQAFLRKYRLDAAEGSDFEKAVMDVQSADEQELQDEGPIESHPYRQDKPRR